MRFKKLHLALLSSITLAIAGCNGGSGGGTTNNSGNNITPVPTPTPTLTPSPSPSPSPSPTPVPALPLQLSNFSESNILSNGLGNWATITASLNISSGVNNLHVNFIPSNNSIILSPKTCILTTESSNCVITVIGESVSSSVTITANAAGYSSLNSTQLNVYKQLTPTLTMPNAVTNSYSLTATALTFSGPIDLNTVSTSNFIVSMTSGGSSIGGTFTTDAGESVITFSPTMAEKFATLYYVTTVSGIKDSHGQPVMTFNSNSYKTPYKIYTATNNGNGWNGNLVAAGQMINPGLANDGVQAADTLCKADSQCPVGSTCKAMLADDNGTREAYPNLKNWVLEPSTAYMNESGVFIGTTNTNSLLNLPLSNAINPDVSTFSDWTGINPNTGWNTTIGSTCNSWSNSASGFGSRGNPNYLSTFVILHLVTSCNTFNGLYCVQQP